MLPGSSLVLIMNDYVAGSYAALMAKLGDLDSIQALSTRGKLLSDIRLHSYAVPTNAASSGHYATSPFSGEEIHTQGDTEYQDKYNVIIIVNKQPFDISCSKS